MLIKLRNYVSTKLHSMKNAVSDSAVYITGAILISLIPSVSFGGAIIDVGPDGGVVSAGPVTVAWGSGMQSAGGIGDALCTIVGWFTDGGVGSAVASLAVIFLGIGAFFGKVTWGMALMFACGIFAIFGSASIVNAITGDVGFGQACGGGVI